MAVAEDSERNERQFLDPKLKAAIGDDDLDSFEQKTLKKVNADYTRAQAFMRTFHAACLKAYRWYHAADNYEALVKKDRWPVTFFQTQIDVFTSYMMDKLFFKGRPCTTVGVEDTDKGDAQAKQELFDWQDYKDKIYRTFENLVRDAALYRIAVTQIDFKEKKKKQVVGYKEPIPAIDEMTGQPILDEMGEPVIVGIESKIRVDETIVYRGPHVKRIDPTDFFITQEKSEIDDEFPLMIRSRVTLEHFLNNPLYLEGTYDKLKEETVKRGDGSIQGADVPDSQLNKRMVRGLAPEQSESNELELVEWQGLLDKKALYEYSKIPTSVEVDDGMGGTKMEPICGKGEKTWAIVGVVDTKTVVRLEESPFDFDGPNVVVGVIQPDEAELLGVSISDKISPTQRALEILRRMSIENMKQQVNAQWVMKKGAILNYNSAKANNPGQVFETNEDVDKVVKRIEPSMVSPDITLMEGKVTQEGQNASGEQDIITGKGDPATETLGESEIVAGQASLRMSDYLRSLEETLVEPIYQMRNQINMQTLDQNYVYGIIGEGAIEWRTATPGQIRANVDFICESSTRETNRIVITQQILQFAKAAAMAANMGTPVRFDILLGSLAEQGFSWPTRKVQEILPSLKMEQEGVDINGMLMAASLQQMIGSVANAGLAGQPQPGQPGGPTAEATSERDANDSARAQTQTQTGGAI